jgi:hypothetical protein
VIDLSQPGIISAQLCRASQHGGIGHGWSTKLKRGARARSEEEKMRKIVKLIGVGTVAFAINVAAVTAAFARRDDTSLVHACINRITKLARIVGPNDNCGKIETRRHWSIKGPQGPQGPRGPQGIQGPPAPAVSGGLIVKDSLGRVVGRWNYDYLMVRQVGADLLNFSVDAKGFRQGYVTIYYTTPDCTGPRYMFPSRSFGDFYETVLTSDGQTGYFASLDVQDLAIQGYQQFVTGQPVAASGNCLPTFFTEKMGLVSTIDLLSLGAPPFSLE